MHNSQQIKVINTFQISNFGIIVFLKANSQFSGFESGTILNSEYTNKSWYITKRIIEFSEIETHFENETEVNAFLHYGNLQNLIKAKQNATQRSKDRIFQYLFEPILHNDKPEFNETLNIIEFDKILTEKILKTLLRELKFHSNNGENQISSIGYLLSETSKMTGSTMNQIIYHLKFLIDKGYVVKTANESILYNVTEKGKNFDPINSIL